MAKKRSEPDSEMEKLIDTFADVFHSFKDIRKVTPDAFVKKLARKGVTLARVGREQQP